MRLDHVTKKSNAAPFILGFLDICINTNLILIMWSLTAGYIFCSGDRTETFRGTSWKSTTVKGNEHFHLVIFT